MIELNFIGSHSVEPKLEKNSSAKKRSNSYRRLDEDTKSELGKANFYNSTTKQQKGYSLASHKEGYNTNKSMYSEFLTCKNLVL